MSAAEPATTPSEQPALISADDTKKEIYKYVADHFSKTLANRESLISRFQRIQGVAGLMVPCIAFSMPIMSGLIADSITLRHRSILGATVCVLIVASYNIIRAVLSVPDLVGNIPGALPGIPNIDALLKAKRLDGNIVLTELSENYVKACKQIDTACDEAHEKLLQSVRHLTNAIGWTVAFVALTLIASMLIKWKLL